VRIEPMLINLQNLIDDEKCYETVRQLRWPEGVSCPKCDSKRMVKQGRDETEPMRQRYQCKDCQLRFDDLSCTIFAGHHQPLRVWMLYLYLMGLNLSNQQIAAELDLNKDDVQLRTDQLRSGIVQSKPQVILEGEVECDEAYVIAGHKGQPDAVKKRTHWAASAAQNPSRTGNISQGKTANFGHDSTWR